MTGTVANQTDESRAATGTIADNSPTPAVDRHIFAISYLIAVQPVSYGRVRFDEGART